MDTSAIDTSASQKTGTPAPEETAKPISLLRHRAAERSAVFIEQVGRDAVLFKRKSVLQRALKRFIPESGLLIECGVHAGGSINRIARLFPNRKVYGFDSFEGLSEDWGGTFLQKGHFDLAGALPTVEPNVALRKGWVESTLPKFFATNEGPIAFLHIDTDTYSPCKTALQCAKPFLMPGSVILFDELIGYPFWEEGEYRALSEELDENSYKYIAFSDKQAAIVIN